MQRTSLFERYRLGQQDLKNRIVMAPMTRARSLQPGNIPSALMAEYYRQRASADVKALARQHIDELNRKIAELSSLRDTLQDLVESCQGDHRPDCPILKDLAAGSCCH